MMSSHQDPLTNYKTISLLPEPMATERGTMVTFLDGLMRMNSHDHLITWSCEIALETKTIIYP